MMLKFEPVLSKHFIKNSETSKGDVCEGVREYLLVYPEKIQAIVAPTFYIFEDIIDRKASEVPAGMIPMKVTSCSLEDEIVDKATNEAISLMNCTSLYVVEKWEENKPPVFNEKLSIPEMFELVQNTGKTYMEGNYAISGGCFWVESKTGKVYVEKEGDITPLDSI